MQVEAPMGSPCFAYTTMGASKSIQDNMHELSVAMASILCQSGLVDAQSLQVDLFTGKEVAYDFDPANFRAVELASED